MSNYAFTYSILTVYVMVYDGEHYGNNKKPKNIHDKNISVVSNKYQIPVNWEWMITLNRNGHRKHQPPSKCRLSHQESFNFVTAGLETLRTAFLLGKACSTALCTLPITTYWKTSQKWGFDQNSSHLWFFGVWHFKMFDKKKDLLASQQWRAASMTALQPSRCKWRQRFLVSVGFHVKQWYSWTQWLHKDKDKGTQTCSHKRIQN